MVDFYTTINGAYENTIIIEKSKFITYVKGVENEEEAKEFIAQIKKKNSLATHNCYAYIADENSLICKFSDDGEPQGTAGLPMLEVLKSTKTVKCAVVVTRYFGGIKLGAGGLVRAYSGSVAEAIKLAPKLDMYLAKKYNLTVNYEDYSSLLNKIGSLGLNILSTDFNQNVNITFAVKENNLNNTLQFFADFFSGKENLEFLGEGYYPFK